MLLISCITIVKISQNPVLSFDPIENITHWDIGKRNNGKNAKVTGNQLTKMLPINSVRLSWFILFPATIYKFNQLQIASHKGTLLRNFYSVGWKRLEARYNRIETFVSHYYKESATTSSSFDFVTLCTLNVLKYHFKICCKYFYSYNFVKRDFVVAT
jgi:hypothetical protein